MNKGSIQVAEYLVYECIYTKLYVLKHNTLNEAAIFYSGCSHLYHGGLSLYCWNFYEHVHKSGICKYWTWQQ